MPLKVTPADASLEGAHLPFDEQIAFFQAKLGNLIPTRTWRDVRHAGHDTGFMVAGAAKADLLSDFAQAVDSTIADGKSLQWFRQAFDAIVEEHGWSHTGGRDWRSKVIFQTNMTTSYAAGRLAQLRDPELQKLAQYWMYVHNDSVLHPRPLHLSWDKLVLPADDPWFKVHYPPNGWGCMCRVTAVSKAQAKRDGGRFGPAPDDGINPKTGTPNGIDRGFDYMPGDTVTDRIRQTLLEKTAKLPEALGAALRDNLAYDGMDAAAFIGQRPGLRDLPPVVITELTGTEFGDGLSKVDIAKRADALLRELQKGAGLLNDDTGWALRINRKGRAKMGDNAGQTAAESKAVAGIEDLVWRAVLTETHPDLEHGNPDVAAVHRFYAPLSLAGDLYRVKLTAKTFVPDVAQGRVLHAISAVELENAPLGTLLAHETPKASKSQAQPTTERTLSIADLLKGATMSDGKPYTP